ncbi:MAG: hypothetical protein R3F42_08740 [Pseudomonadota bacterium]
MSTLTDHGTTRPATTPASRTQTLPLPLRLANALPDAVTAGIFLSAWIAPFAWRATLVSELMLVMLVEFILIHAAPFLGGVVLADGEPLRQRLRLFAGLTVLYSVFIAGFALPFKSWWPVLAFTWLAGAKLVLLLGGRQHGTHDRQRMRGYWGASVGFYLLAVLATLFLPVPEFGITRHGAAYGIPGSGAWVSHPHTVISAGCLYFGLLALTKMLERPAWWRASGPGTAETA